ncbi:MAG: alpha/beta fold hydrolase [Chloroflexota bacterium]
MKSGRPVSLRVDGLRIAAAAYLPDGHGPFPALCLCHGIPPGPRDPNDQGYPLLAERCCQAGFATTIFNFRGAGESEGNLDMPGWARDLKAVLDYLLSLPEIDRARVNLLGFSAGAAVSVYVTAGDQRVTAVASCACPAEFRFLPDLDKAQEFVEHLRGINLIRDPHFPASIEEWVRGFRDMAPRDWVGRVSPRPLLLVHGDQDELIPLKQARELYERAKQPKELVIIPGAGHRLRRERRAMDIALAWLKRVNRLE